MGKYRDLTGMKFGRLTCVSYAGRNKAGLSLWYCKCDCGMFTTTLASSLNYGSTTSCGCYQKEAALKFNFKHGMSGRVSQARIYRIWRNMKSRCSNPKASKYENYGGRGICVCKEWEEFIPFYNWSMSNGYLDTLSIERIDHNGNYEPQNCKWATSKQQNINKRDNRILTYNGQTMTMLEWSLKIGLKYSTLRCRIDYYKWSIEDALTLPKKSAKRGLICD